ncbi:4Fe-4S binding protein [bacterium]|nr:4Fe-4S binding protein [bacterium]
MTSTIEYIRSRCDFCGTCVGVCPADAIELDEADLRIVQAECLLCMACVNVCPLGALEEKL